MRVTVYGTAVWIVYPSCSALQGPSEEHVVTVGDKNCNLQDASVRYDHNLTCRRKHCKYHYILVTLEYIYIVFAVSGP